MVGANGVSAVIAVRIILGMPICPDDGEAIPLKGGIRLCCHAIPMKVCFASSYRFGSTYGEAWRGDESPLQID